MWEDEISDALRGLDDFLRSLAVARSVEARHYVTFHQAGVVSDRDHYVQRLDRYTAVIGRREAAMVAYLRGGPRTLDELASHRFVYRPHVEEAVYVPSAERRSAEQSLRRLIASAQVRKVEPARYLAV